MMPDWAKILMMARLSEIPLGNHWLFPQFAKDRIDIVKLDAILKQHAHQEWSALRFEQVQRDCGSPASDQSSMRMPPNDLLQRLLSNLHLQMHALMT